MSFNLGENLFCRFIFPGTIRWNKSEIPEIFLISPTRLVGSSIFGFKDYLSLVSFVPKKNKAVYLVFSKHHDDQINEVNKKPLIIMDYNKSKGIIFAYLIDSKKIIFYSNRKLAWTLLTK